LRDSRAARREAAIEDPAPRQLASDRRQAELERQAARPESRHEEASDLRRSTRDGRDAGPPAELPPGPSAEPRPATAATPRRRPAGDWTEPELPEVPSQYAVYRPGSGPVPVSPGAPVRRPESTPVG
jgi:hypothetical protein